MSRTGAQACSNGAADAAAHGVVWGLSARHCPPHMQCLTSSHLLQKGEAIMACSSGLKAMACHCTEAPWSAWRNRTPGRQNAWQMQGLEQRVACAQRPSTLPRRNSHRQHAVSLRYSPGTCPSSIPLQSAPGRAAPLSKRLQATARRYQTTARRADPPPTQAPSPNSAFLSLLLTDARSPA